MEQIVHASLFTGIGGFDLAAEWKGWHNAFQCEIDDWCRNKLSKLFPQSQQYADIKDQNFKQWKDKITVLSGGFPCQPFSIAGEKKGGEDERFLWGEMYRAIKQICPPFVVAENVPGLLTKKHALLFEQMCVDLENEGYEVQSFVIPACGVNAPHRRYRVWIVAFSNNYLKRQLQQERSIQKKRGRIRNSDTNASDLLITNQERSGSKREGEIGFTNDNQFTTNDIGKRQQEQRKYRGWSSSEENEEWEADKFINGSQFKREWTEVASKFCRVDDGISKGLDRRKRIEALGNAIVPQIAFEVFGIVDYLIAWHKTGAALTNKGIKSLKVIRPTIKENDYKPVQMGLFDS